jgi:hypothetical protein
MSKRLIVTISALIIVLGGGYATALADGEAPHTNAVAGAFSAAPVDVQRRTCAGADGPYLELRGQWKGVVTSNDPRLAGTFVFSAEPALVNLATGLGTFQGRFEVLDPKTGQEKANGNFHTVVTEASFNHGFALGKVISAGGHADDDEPSDNFFANIQAKLDPSLNVTGEYGGAGDLRTPAVTQAGHCSGPFTKMP